MYPYGGGVATTTTYVSVPQTYSRVVYSYPSFYDRRMDFMVGNLVVFDRGASLGSLVVH